MVSLRSEERSGGLSGVSGCYHPLSVSVGAAGRPSILCCSRTEGGRREEGQEEERPERAAEARVCVRTLLQRHAGRHQGPEPQRHLRRSVQDRGLHVGQSGRRAEAGTELCIMSMSYSHYSPGFMLSALRCGLEFDSSGKICFQTFSPI